MELGLTYDEVVNKIPYRNLLIMQKDKLRPCYGIKMVEATDEDYMREYNKTLVTE